MNYNLIHLLMKKTKENNKLEEKVSYIVVDALHEYNNSAKLKLESGNRRNLEEEISKFKENSSENH